MGKKGNPHKIKKRFRNIKSKVITRKYGHIPKYRRYCIICKLIYDKVNNENLTVHHDKLRHLGEDNSPKNLEIICEKHHKQLHHKYFFKKVKRVYEEYRKAKFNKIRTT